MAQLSESMFQTAQDIREPTSTTCSASLQGEDTPKWFVPRITTNIELALEIMVQGLFTDPRPQPLLAQGPGKHQDPCIPKEQGSRWQADT